jgi:hypothetical protein
MWVALSCSSKSWASYRIVSYLKELAYTKTYVFLFSSLESNGHFFLVLDSGHVVVIRQ